MKKILMFLPLGVGISSALIYIFNIIHFRIVNNSATLLQILSTLKVYLYISIIGFVVYFLIRVLYALENKNKVEKEASINQTVSNNTNEPPLMDKKGDINEVVTDDTYEPFEIDDKITFEDTLNIDIPVEDKKNKVINEIKPEEKIVFRNSKYCFNCGENIDLYAKFCPCCGAKQESNKKRINPVLKNIINVIEIVIMLLIIYFSLIMLFDYKESKDPNFESPFKISMTR